MSKSNLIGLLLIITGWVMVWLPLDISPLSVEFWSLLIGVGAISLGHSIRR